MRGARGGYGGGIGRYGLGGGDPRSLMMDSYGMQEQYDPFMYGGDVDPYGGQGMGMPQMPTGDGTGFGLPGGVLACFGLDDKTNCDHLYNIFCLYGNVVKVMFLKKNKQNCLIQMGDSVAAQQVLEYASRFKLFGGQVNLKPRETDTIHGMKDPEMRDDGTCSYKDYSDEIGQRYINHKMASKNKPASPSKSLYMFNLPIDTTKEKAEQVFRDKGATVPEIKIFENKLGGDAKVIAGMAEFTNVEEATDALALVNNFPLYHDSSERPYLMKLAFARLSSGERGNRFDGGGGGFRGGRGGNRGGGGGFRGRGGGPPRGGRGSFGGMPTGMGFGGGMRSNPYGGSAPYGASTPYGASAGGWGAMASQELDFEEDTGMQMGYGYGMGGGGGPMRGGRGRGRGRPSWM